MQVVIRVDASPEIGTGHVVRCMTLADELSRRGARLAFVSRHLPETHRDALVSRGHEVLLLPQHEQVERDDLLAHSQWLGTSQSRDADDTLAALGDRAVDWLIVDHYALDVRWESIMRHAARKVMVIDDIADRRHDCDVLLDQNYYRNGDARYTGLVPPGCHKLIGPRFALLRHEFAQARESVLTRSGAIKRIFVFFGGGDVGDQTSLVLNVLSEIRGRSSSFMADVVLGSSNSSPVKRPSDAELWARFHFDVTNMAQLMAGADLCLGAAGATTWERAAVGLPTLAVSMALNQRQIARDAEDLGVLSWLGDAADVSAERWKDAIEKRFADQTRHRAESEMGLRLIDALGALRVVQLMLEDVS